MWRKALALACLSWMNVAQAQESTFSQWLSVPITVDAGEKPSRFQFWTDLHARRSSGSTLLILRPAVGWRFNKIVTAHVGYAYIPNFTDGGGFSSEHRVWEQVILNAKLGTIGKFQSRTRFEQRFAGNDPAVALRIREFIRFGVHFGENSPFQFLVWDEIFLGLNDPGWAPQGYDQNRLFVGPGVDVEPLGGRLELGYMFNHLNRTPDIFNHVLFTQLVIAL